MDDLRPLTISVMLAVDSVPAAVEWYRKAIGAEVQWDLGSVAGLRVSGAPLLLGEPGNNGWATPATLGMTSTRVEIFVTDPDAFVDRAVAAGATAGDPIEVHSMPWGPHRQGTFTDPFGHLWFVGDHSPLDGRT
ncbi:VOC family protein [Microlunatus speluncae]|uniref:VOC family protein n=1 Tax=Microlunatus speluncae TaxID=2594267 RepID=UPI0012663679|nr:VOC family protein [Microlunatus speluncae]